MNYELPGRPEKLRNGHFYRPNGFQKIKRRKEADVLNCERGGFPLERNLGNDIETVLKNRAKVCLIRTRLLNLHFESA